MKNILLAITLFMLFPAAVGAQTPEPGPTPGPYIEFEAHDLEAAPPIEGLDLVNLIAAPEFLQEFGAAPMTMFAMLDGFAGGGVLSYMVILIAGLLAIGWLARYVFKQRQARTYDYGGSGERSAAEDDEDGLPNDWRGVGSLWSAVGRELARRKNMRF